MNSSPGAGTLHSLSNLSAKRKPAVVTEPVPGNTLDVQTGCVMMLHHCLGILWPLFLVPKTAVQSQATEFINMKRLEQAMLALLYEQKPHPLSRQAWETCVLAVVFQQA